MCELFLDRGIIFRIDKWQCQPLREIFTSRQEMKNSSSRGRLEMCWAVNVKIIGEED